ncbi:MAG TPA: hypothetical protein VKR59_01600 [Terriglobales bacterium]|nr:hypothetical protein [Terriglobales bacterium]
MTVGGGFAGLTFTLQSLFTSLGHGFLNSLLMFVAVVLYAFVFVSGLIFAHDPHRTTPLSVALAIQVPWISSPFVTYEFGAGIQAALSVGNIEQGRFGFHLGADSIVGCMFRFNLLQENRWTIGVNVVALTIFVLLWRATHTLAPNAQTLVGPPAQPSPVAIPSDTNEINAISPAENFGSRENWAKNALVLGILVGSTRANSCGISSCNFDLLSYVPMACGL